MRILTIVSFVSLNAIRKDIKPIKEINPSIVWVVLNGLHIVKNNFCYQNNSFDSSLLKSDFVAEWPCLCSFAEAIVRCMLKVKHDFNIGIRLHGFCLFWKIKFVGQIIKWSNYLLFLQISKLSFKKGAKMVENPGIDPGTFRMQSGRSTTWANSPNCAHKPSFARVFFVSARRAQSKAFR